MEIIATIFSLKVLKFVLYLMFGAITGIYFVIQVIFQYQKYKKGSAPDIIDYHILAYAIVVSALLLYAAKSALLAIP